MTNRSSALNKVHFSTGASGSCLRPVIVSRDTIVLIKRFFFFNEQILKEHKSKIIIIMMMTIVKKKEKKKASTRWIQNLQSKPTARQKCLSTPKHVLRRPSSVLVRPLLLPPPPHSSAHLTCLSVVSPVSLPCACLLVASSPCLVSQSPRRPSSLLDCPQLASPPSPPALYLE